MCEDSNQLGFIAQEVKEVFPKSVKISNDYDIEDFHSLDTDQLLKCCFGAVQKLMKKVEELQCKINNLEFDYERAPVKNNYNCVIDESLGDGSI